MRAPSFHLFDALVPAVAVAIWGGLVAGADDLAQQRGLVFVGGPLVLLAGLHARITDYLHDRARLRTLPRPLAPEVHWQAARPRHRAGLLVTAGLGGVGLALTGAWALVVDWLLLVAAAALVEPLVPAVSSDLGRRLPAGSRGAALQRTLGGGLTLPEATVHLWAPAFAVGLAAAVAMPGQLTLDRIVDGKTVRVALWGISVAPWAVVGALRLGARARYAGGLWEAVPWLHETTRTLAGPARPHQTPRWIGLVPNPAARLWLLQLGRQTPLPALRLVLLGGGAAAVTLGGGGTGTFGLATVAALAALWMLPAWPVVTDPGRARFLAPLPLAGVGLWPAGVVLGPAVLAVAASLAAGGGG